MPDEPRTDREARRPLRRGAKRAMDILLASIGLVLLGPLMAVLAVLIRLNMGSPVLFRQVRPGYRGVPFEIVKFRTMIDPPGDGRPGLERDRTTALGALLRRVSLDELPELWNILKGDMSVVGPRPLLMEFLPLYTAEESRRHDVPPGLTGWAQVNGRRLVGMPDRFVLDVWYVDHWSLALDLRIIAMTFAMVVRGEGVEPAGDDDAVAPSWHDHQVQP
jgi:lipopolysaccharide/colanic/teichoic acid biosynthesis glycosyltransferase